VIEESPIGHKILLLCAGQIDYFTRTGDHDEYRVFKITLDALSARALNSLIRIGVPLWG
jgi:hypothetical protein